MTLDLRIHPLPCCCHLPPRLCTSGRALPRCRSHPSIACAGCARSCAALVDWTPPLSHAAFSETQKAFCHSVGCCTQQRVHCICDTGLKRAKVWYQLLMPSKPQTISRYYSRTFFPRISYLLNVNNNTSHFNVSNWTKSNVLSSVMTSALPALANFNIEMFTDLPWLAPHTAWTDISGVFCLGPRTSSCPCRSHTEHNLQSSYMAHTLRTYAQNASPGGEIGHQC